VLTQLYSFKLQSRWFSDREYDVTKIRFSMLHKLLQTAFSHCERSLTIGSLHSERGVGILRFSVFRMGRERCTFLMTHLHGNVSSLPSVLETWEGKYGLRNEGNRHMAWVRLAYAIVWRNGRRVCIIKWSLTFRAFLSQDILLIINPLRMLRCM